MNSDALAKLEHDILTNINSLRDKVINMKDIVIKRLLEEIKNLHQRCRNLENKLVSTEYSLNQLEQCGRQKIV